MSKVQLIQITLIVLFFLSCDCIWFPQIVNVQTGPDGFIPTTNLSVTLAANQSGLIVSNDLNKNISVSCNTTTISVGPLSYSDYFGCLQPNSNNSLNIMNENGTVIAVYHYFVDSPGAYYILVVSESAGNISTNITSWDPDYYCNFMIRSPYGYGLPAFTINPLSLTCQVPIFPSTDNPIAGAQVNFTGLSASYPNKKNYRFGGYWPFMLKSYCVSAINSDNNSTTINTGSNVIVTGAFFLNSTYSCTFSSGDVTVVVFSSSNNGTQITCQMPTTNFDSNAVLQFNVLEEFESNVKSMKFISNKPTFTFQSLTSQTNWTIIAGVVGLIVGAIISASIAGLIILCRRLRHRHHYETF